MAESNETRDQAVLFSDLRDFTKTTVERGDREAFALFRRFASLTDEQVARAGGRVVKNYGDGVMTSFPSASLGADCAIELQRALDARNREAPEETLSAGIGISWGAPIEEGGDLFGHSVNLAKRLADVAKGGQIVLSNAVRDQMDESDRWRFRDLGLQSLKGLQPERLFELIWRDEVTRLTDEEGVMNLVLTEDHRLVIELHKEAQRKIREAQHKVREEAERERGLAGWILRMVERSLPAVIEYGLARTGIGLQQDLGNVEVAVEGGKLSVRVGGKQYVKGLQVDPKQAQAFLEAVQHLKGTEAPPNH